MYPLLLLATRVVVTCVIAFISSIASLTSVSVASCAIRGEVSAPYDTVNVPAVLEAVFVKAIDCTSSVPLFLYHSTLYFQLGIHSYQRHPN